MTQAPAVPEGLIARLYDVATSITTFSEYSRVCSEAGNFLSKLAAAPHTAAPAADRAVSEPASLRQPMPDDLLTVANIASDGVTLTLEINQLGDLVHLIGEDERTCTLTIAPMRRADFDDLGDFDGF